VADPERSKVHSYKRDGRGEMSKLTKRLISIIEKINDLMKLPSMFLMIALSAIIIYEVIMRYFFNRPSVFSSEVSQMIQVCLAMIGAGYVQKIEKHVSVDMVFVKLNHKSRAHVGFCFSVLGAVYCGVLAWLGWLSVRASFNMGERTIDIAAPLWPIKMIFLLGMCLFGLQFVVDSYNYYHSKGK
jgi:TRAP-type C4-dicarboxylate transport system permease small subunit